MLKSSNKSETIIFVVGLRLYPTRVIFIQSVEVSFSIFKNWRSETQVPYPWYTVQLWLSIKMKGHSFLKIFLAMPILLKYA